MFTENRGRPFGIAGFAALMLGLGFASGFFTERQLLANGVSNAAVGGAPQPSDVDFAPVWKAWSVINEKFVPAAVATSTPVASTTAQENQNRIWGMIGGLAASLNDPYTFF